MKKIKIFLFTIIGGLIGLAIVRVYILNSIQIMGWNLFWKNLSHLNIDRMEFIYKSDVFGRCILGFIIGAIVGFIMGKILYKK